MKQICLFFRPGPPRTPQTGRNWPELAGAIIFIPAQTPQTPPNRPELAGTGGDSSKALGERGLDWVRSHWHGRGARKALQAFDFIRFGAMDVTEPYQFIGFGEIQCPKPYKIKGAGWAFISQTPAAWAWNT